MKTIFNSDSSQIESVEIHSNFLVIANLRKYFKKKSTHVGLLLIHIILKEFEIHPIFIGCQL